MKAKQTDARIKNAVHEPARLALFGGSFDPVHCGHLEIGNCALQQTGADCVVFIPAYRSPMKHRPFANDADRMQMLRLALQDEIRFELNTFEVEQSGYSFTINTVDHFRELYCDAELFWIIGEDQFTSLNKWHRIDELMKKITFLVYPRLAGQRMFEQTIHGLRYQLLKADTIPVSSTEIRERCGKERPLSGLVPDSVEAFIYKKGLYKKGN